MIRALQEAGPTWGRINRWKMKALALIPTLDHKPEREARLAAAIRAVSWTRESEPSPPYVRLSIWLDAEPVLDQ
jgi:hypothetical protein